jgi:hypothetical protein
VRLGHGHRHRCYLALSMMLQRLVPQEAGRSFILIRFFMKAHSIAPAGTVSTTVSPVPFPLNVCRQSKLSNADSTVRLPCWHGMPRDWVRVALLSWVYHLRGKQLKSLGDFWLLSPTNDRPKWFNISQFCGGLVRETHLHLYMARDIIRKGARVALK